MFIKLFSFSVISLWKLSSVFFLVSKSKKFMPISVLIFTSTEIGFLSFHLTKFTFLFKWNVRVRPWPWLFYLPSFVDLFMFREKMFKYLYSGCSNFESRKNNHARIQPILKIEGNTILQRLEILDNFFFFFENVFHHMMKSFGKL